jgi:pimeloyl-ACP methyl ester carboxylesterase
MRRNRGTNVPEELRRTMMRRRTFVAMAAASGVSLAAPIRGFTRANAATATPPPGNGVVAGSPPQTGYAPVNGLEMYYEIHGRGEPLVLLHGAYGAIGLWGPILTTLAEHRQVIAVELQGHGHTADIDRPFDYEHFADDVAGLMDHLALAHADVVGYSMGGTTALQVAIRHPKLVRKLVVIAANYRKDGFYPAVLAGLGALTPEVFAGSPEEEIYLRTAPHPEDFPVLVEKHNALDTLEFAFPDEDIRVIAAPTQLLFGDSDIVRLDHAVEMFQLRGGGVPGDFVGLPATQLAILPGTTHLTIVSERTDVLVTMIDTFLAAPMPEGA